MEETATKRSLLLYALISALSFIYLIMHAKAAISVPIFMVIQFAFWFYLAPKKKPLWFFVPIFIMALNPFISANPIWHVSNFIVTILLYSIMVLTMIDRFPVKEDSLAFISNTLVNAFAPFKYFPLPFKWWSAANANKTEIIKRVIKGLLITIPCLVVLIALLSSADTIFLKGTGSFFRYVGYCMDFGFVFKIICGLVIGLYLFGLVYISHKHKDVGEEDVPVVMHKNGDLTVLNILLISVLAVYTLFVFIQFRYLFAGGGHLPYGLSYTEYARKGFFELLFLSGLNILLILITVNLTRANQGLWTKITRYLCHYLCLVTIIMLTSSFYRMWLYSSDDGLTRLRFLVFGFLIFEAIGLLITFFYISKPDFNIAAVYLTIGLTYYLILNLLPIDTFIAQDQINRLLDGRRPGIEYVLTLSPDAAPQVARLLDSDIVNQEAKNQAYTYFQHVNDLYLNQNGWQEYNLSVQRGHNLSVFYLYTHP